MRLQKNHAFTLSAIVVSIVTSIFVVSSATAAEKPRFGEYGFDTSGMQKSVKPGDDFYKHLNGEWEKNTPIPADKAMYGTFHLLIDQSQKNTRAIVENAAQSDGAASALSADAQKVGNAYRAYMGTAEIEKRDVAPLQPLLAVIEKISNQDELITAMARLKREYGVRVPITTSVEQDGKNPDRYWVELSQSGLGMGNRDLYDTTKTQFEKQYGEKLTFTPIFILAIAKAIREMPMVNLSVEGDKIIVKKDINIGVAAALPDDNLIVPVIKHADRLNLVGLAAAVNDLAGRARNRKLKPEELEGGTYSITNVGTFGNVMGTPIIMQPQVAILATGAIRKLPAVVETETGDMIAIRHKMFLSHSYDHRVVNGALGGRFVRRVADILEAWDMNTPI